MGTIIDNSKGSGYISIYNFSEEFVKNDTFLDSKLKNMYVGGLGAVVYINYESSSVGPYKQLLFIPGKFESNGKSRYVISKAYVSTQAAADFCKEKLSCDAEVANFEQKSITDDIEHVSICNEKGNILSFEIEEWGLRFPVSTSLVNFPIMQLDEDGTPMLFEYKGEGEARFSKRISIEIRPALFPDFAQFSSIAMVKIDKFSLSFEK